MLFEQELAVEEKPQVPPDGFGGEGGSTREGSETQVNRERRSRPSAREVEDLRLVMFKYEA
jgi:hypothetical protein